MDKQKFGFILFLIGAIFLMVLSGFGGYNIFIPTNVQASATASVADDVLYWIWALSVPISGILIGIGMYFYIQAEGARTGLFVLVVFLGWFIFGFLMRGPFVIPHVSYFYGIMGAIIAALFLGTIWLWSKDRKTLEGSATRVADFQLIGYTFFLFTAWFLCDWAGDQFLIPAVPLRSPYEVMVFFVLGWFFLLMSHYKAKQLQ